MKYYCSFGIFQPFKNVKAILNSRAVQNQVAGLMWPGREATVWHPPSPLDLEIKAMIADKIQAPTK